MKLEKLVGERFKERPADCVIDSHAIMVKGGSETSGRSHHTHDELLQIPNSMLKVPVLSG